MAATYTVKQVAEILGYSTNSIYTFLKAKRIKGVRVGKGRFRIPQSELDRLLLVSKKGSANISSAVIQPTPPTVTVPAIGVADAVGGSIITETKLLGFIHLGTLNIFDWFIGVSAMISGIALFLFNTSLDKFGVTANAPGLNAIRIILIGCGLGILATNITGHTHRIWHKLFHILLGIGGIVMTAVFVANGEIDGAMTYGILALLTIAATFIHVGGAAWVCIFMSLLSPVVPLTFLFMQSHEALAGTLSMVPFTTPVAIAAASVLTIIFWCSIWWGYFRSKGVFWITTWLAAIGYFSIAFWYANSSYWSRSFLFLIIGMTSLFLYPWEELVAARSRKADIFALGVFGGVFAVLLAGLAAVFLMQTNSVATVERENAYKAAYAKNSFETTILGIQDALLAAADNQSFVAGVVKGDLTVINNTERIIYESNNAIRRIVLLDGSGMGVNLYPEGTFGQRDLSFRDYFKTARDTGKPTVSNIIEANTDNSRRLVISVAVPLFDAKKVFVGVLVGSVNLEAVGARLQKIGVPDRDEYVVVVDSLGKRIIHPDMKLIGTTTEKDDLIRLGLLGQSGAGTGITSDGIRAVIVYTPVNVNGFNWGIAIKSPVAKLYQLTEISNLSLFAAIVAAVILAGIVLQAGFFYRRKRLPGGSP